MGLLRPLFLGTLLVGCGRLDFASVPDAPVPDGPTVTHACNSVARIADDFEDGVDANKRWIDAYAAPGMSFTESFGEVVITLASNSTNAFAGYKSDRYYDLRGDRFWTEISAFPDPAAEIGLAVDYGSGSYLHVGIQNGTVRATQSVGGVYDVLGSAAYDTSQRFIALREEAGQIFFETSTDGVTFVPFHAASDPFDVSLVQVSIFAGTGVPVPSPGVARFAAINGGTPQNIPGCPVSSLIDTFEDGVSDQRWARTFVNGCCLESESAGRLVLTSDGTTGYVGRRSAAGYSLREDALVFQVPTGPTVGSNVFADVGLREADNRLAIQIKDTQLGCWIDRNGVGDNTYLTRDVGEVYFRIRHTAGQVYWEASADKVAWRLLRKVDEPFSLDDLDVGLEMGTSTPTSASQVTYDDLNVP